MAKDTKVRLDGVEYTVPALNIGQLEEVAEIFDGPRTKIPFAVLRLALRRATPTPDFDSMTPSMEEVGTAVQEILGLAGLEKAPENPPPVLTVVKSD